VFTSREHIIALEARSNGLLGVTLRIEKRGGRATKADDEEA
jgi:hypothetical protein